MFGLKKIVFPGYEGISKLLQKRKSIFLDPTKTYVFINFSVEAGQILTVEFS